MKSISESIIGRKGSHGHRLTWDMNKSMYTDPEDIIAMLLSGHYIVFNDEGEYRISRNANCEEVRIRIPSNMVKLTQHIPIDSFAFFEEALPQLEEEGYKIETPPITKSWKVAFIDK